VVGQKIIEAAAHGQARRMSGTAELGSCLTDATPKADPDVPSSIRRYVRPERLALAIVAAFVTRWYHLQNLRVGLARPVKGTPKQNNLDSRVCRNRCRMELYEFQVLWQSDHTVINY
jgi:hypothetical protein